jgi:hypothetical protein
MKRQKVKGKREKQEKALSAPAAFFGSLPASSLFPFAFFLLPFSCLLVSTFLPFTFFLFPCQRS